MVTLVCAGQTVEKRFTDSKGAFSFSFSPSATGGGDASAGRPALANAACLVHAALPGFTAEPVRIENILAGGGPLRVRLSLRPLQSGGLTYSGTTLAASPQARTALEQSVAADAKYFNPYPMLAQLDLNERKWEDLARHTQTAIQLNPLFSPDLYLLSAQANLKLNRWEVAEKHAREAIQMDTQRKWPVALRLLGATLAAQGKNAEAAAQYRAFLAASPGAADGTEIRAEIEKLERP